jgi:hypothetical protein
MFGFSIWAQLSHLVVSIYRLTLLNEPWWDKDMVTRTIDLSQVLDEMLNRVGSRSQPAGSEEDADNRVAMFYLVKSIRAIKAAWGPLLAPKPTGKATTSTESFDVGGSDGTRETTPELVPGLMEDLDGWMEMLLRPGCTAIWPSEMASLFILPVIRPHLETESPTPRFHRYLNPPSHHAVRCREYRGESEPISHPPCATSTGP